MTDYAQTLYFRIIGISFYVMAKDAVAASFALQPHSRVSRELASAELTDAFVDAIEYAAGSGEPFASNKLEVPFSALFFPSAPRYEFMLESDHLDPLFYLRDVARAASRTPQDVVREFAELLAPFRSVKHRIWQSTECVLAALFWRNLVEEVERTDESISFRCPPWGEGIMTLDAMVLELHGQGIDLPAIAEEIVRAPRITTEAQ